MSDDELVTVSATIPRGRTGEFYALVARMSGPDGDSDGQTNGEERPRPGGGPRPTRAEAGFGAATVKKNYQGGTSGYWRPFLDELAAHPDEWVDWHDLCKKIGMPPERASGMLGAAERRCKGLPPYYKEQSADGHRFYMPASAARIIRGLAAEG